MACDQEIEDFVHPVVGRWVSDPPEDVILMFHDDGSMILDDRLRKSVVYGTWEWDEPTLTMTFTRLDSDTLDDPVILQVQPRTLTRLCIPDIELDRETCFARR